MQKIGLQLYTVREESKKDFFGTLQKLADLGIKGVEFAGFFDVSAVELKTVIDRLGLCPISSHVAIELIRADIHAVMDYHKILGCTDIVIPYYTITTLEQRDAFTQEINAFGKILNENGFNLYYHNHAHEFKKLNGSYILDLLFENCPDLLCELDTYWVMVGGEIPKNYITKHKDITKLIHLKDGFGAEDNQTAIGEGKMDIQSILDVAKQLNIEWLILESDYPVPDGMTFVEHSLRNLKENYQV